MAYAAQFAKKYGGSINLLHVQELPYISMESPITGFEEAYLKMKGDADKEMEKLCEETEAEYGVTCTREVSSINLPLAISREAMGGYDIIIMGASDKDSIDGNLFGNNAFQAIRNTECPLLVVPEGFDYEEIKKMVFATDYQSQEKVTLKQLKQFFDKVCPEMTVLHVSEKDTEVSQEVYKAFKSYVEDELGCPKELHFKRVVDEDEVNGINNYMETGDDNLLVLTTKSRNFLQAMLHKSITKRITKKATYPVLVLHT